MPATAHYRPWCGRASLATALALALCAGACSSDSSDVSAAVPQHGYSGSGTLMDLFSTSSATSPQTASGGQADCPPLEVRQGASTLSIGPPGDNAAMSLKYQGEFMREARECSVVAGNMVMRIGVQGRIIVGPAGGPGQVDVPLRIAVVQETPGGMKPIVTKFIRIPVVVGAGVGNTIFSHIEEGLSFPLPMPTSLLGDYVAYVGFDPLSAQAQEKAKKPSVKRRPKGHLKPSASAN